MGSVTKYISKEDSDHKNIEHQITVHPFKLKFRNRCFDAICNVKTCFGTLAPFLKKYRTAPTVRVLGWITLVDKHTIIQVIGD